MAHDHPHHDHPHKMSGRGSRTQSLVWTLAFVVAYTVAEVLGGLWSGSLALLADAGHMVSDAAALALTLFAIRFARKAPTAERTYGFHRAEILAALVNGVTLIAIAIFICIEAYERLQHPTEVQGGLMLGVAAGGLVVNLAGLWLLHGGHEHDLNVRGAWLHVLTDALGSVQAIVAGVLIVAYGWHWVDSLASILIALLVVYSAWSLITQSLSVLMEGAPRHIKVDDVREALKGLETVEDVHDLHIWSITSGFVSLSAHLVVNETSNHRLVLESSERLLADRFCIRHTTIQIDSCTSCDQAHHGVHHQAMAEAGLPAASFDR
jgi:cobalt-zinc-cadmium efflux system protein